MILTKETLFNCLVFYDYDVANVQVKALYEYGLDFYKSYNQIPKRMALEGKDVPYAAKTKSYRHYDKKIREVNFQHIDSIWLGGGYPKDHGDDEEDCYIGFHIGLDNLKFICLYFYDELIPFNSPYFQKLAQDIASLTDARYGACYQRTRYQGVYGDAMGGVYSHYIEEKKSENSRWYRAYNDPYKDCGTYKTGDLRDIYPMNFLSQEHLDRKVFETTLKDWVAADSSRGTIMPLEGTSLWTWEVASKNIPLLREALKPTDLLVCFRPYQ